MAHFLRGKQSGVQRDFSSGLDSRLFATDLIARYGINSQISALAYDPTQSLLAVGTNDTKFGHGQIYIFGQSRVSVILKLSRKASVKSIHFCSDKLLCVDNKNDISIFALDTTRIIASYSPPGLVTAIASDPTLDYVIIGLQNGEVIAYDLDRQNLAPFGIPNVWTQQNPRSRPTSVVSLAFHPRDIGTLLIGYAEGAVIYSFQQNGPTKFLRYELPPGAPGGDLEPTSARIARYPRLNQALWHPTGTFILTCHEDSSLVFWDSKDGRKVLARTVSAVGIDQPGASSSVSRSASGGFAVAEPLFRVAWCCKENPDDTGILIAGGRSTTEPVKGLTFFDLGPTPNYATSSWQILSDHFANPKRQHLLPTPPNAEVVNFCLIPRKTPHFAGCCDPIAVISTLASGEVITSSFPSGHPITPTNQLHVSLSFVHPFANRFDIGYVDRTQWLGMVENRSRGPPILKGGVESKKSLMKFANRNIIQTAHADGTVRVWDAGHGDEVENESVLQIDVARAVGRFHDVDVAMMSIAGTTGELAVGLKSGEVLIFRWGKNKNFGHDLPHKDARGFGLEAILDRAEPDLKEGMLPLSLYDNQRASVCAIKMSEVGFVVAGFDNGALAVMDLRGPALIYEANLNDLGGQTAKRSSIRRSNDPGSGRAERATTLEFGVMTLDGDDYSSILLFVGSDIGRLLTFKILPDPSGAYSIKFVGANPLDDIIVAISPISADTGSLAAASPSAVGGLRNGNKVNGVLVVAMRSSARIFKPATSKGASKSWDQVFLDSAGVVRFEAHTYCLMGLFGDGTVKAFSLPGLRELVSMPLADCLDVRRFSEAVITPTGFVFGWRGPSEIDIVNVWGTGQDLTRSLDRLFNVEALISARPTISNLQWISGTSYVSPADMDKLIGGPDRPPSKRMIEQQRADEAARQSASRQVNSQPGSARQKPGQQDEGYWAYMQRQIQERTENLGLTEDSMDKLEDNSQGWADDVNKFVSSQKKKMIMGAIGSKFGL